MKFKVLTPPLLLFGLAMLLLFSCSKQVKEEQIEVKSNLLDVKIIEWVNIHAVVNKQSKSGHNLTEFLDLNAVQSESYNSGESFVVIPLKESFKTGYNIDKTTSNVLLLALDKAGNIKAGNVVSYYPEDRTKRSFIPKNTFPSIFNHKDITVNGKFKFFALNGRAIYDLTFKDGKVYSVGTYKTKASNSSVSSSKSTSKCTAYYLETTYYYSDGTSVTVTDYLGTECVDSGGCGGYNEGLCPTDESGGGTNLEYEYTVNKDISWVVAEPSNHFWYVRSVEKLQGMKNTALPGGGKITGITHNGDQIINVVSSNYATWSRVGTPTFNYSSTYASCSMSGKVIISGQGDIPVPTRTQTWYPTDL